MVGPRNDLLYRFLFSFPNELDAPVGPVLHPAGDAQAPRLALRCRPKEDPGDATANDKVNSLG